MNSGALKTLCISHVSERTLRSPLVLTYLASETCARVLKANWKLFPGTTPRSTPFDSWIIFLKFWRNLAFFPPSVHFWCWAVSGFPTLLPVREKKPQKCSKAKFVHRAAIPPQKAEEFSCQQWVQGGERRLLMSSPAACLQSPPLHQRTSEPHGPSRARIRESTNRKHTDKSNIHIWLTNFPT